MALTLADVAAAVQALQGRMDAMEQAVPTIREAIKANTDGRKETDDTVAHLLDRADDLGALLQKARRNARVAAQQQIDPEALDQNGSGRLMPRVKSVRVGNKTVKRAVRRA